MKKSVVLVLVAVLAFGAAFVTFGQSASAGKIVGPIEYPEGQPVAGSTGVKTFNLTDIVEYKALPKYSEPAYVTDLVKAGKLPPVEKRLPPKPFVLKTSFMSNGKGTYGGVFSNVFAVPVEGWNFFAGTVTGWFGIEEITNESLLRNGPSYLRKDKVEPLPNLATDWTWSKDGKSLTMNLIQGVKWSDGVPFTADDVMFLWNDNIQDKNVAAWTGTNNWQIDGKPITLEKINDYQIKWTFPVAFPLYKLWDMCEQNTDIPPAHILKKFHPKYNKDSNYAAYKDCLPPNKLPIVTLSPWVPVQYKTDEILVLRRNPYFWKVDSEGQQLPYMDEVQYVYAKTGVTRTVNTMAGSCDTSNIENPETFDEVVQKSVEANSPFRCEWGPETLGFDLEINQSADFGVKTDRDRALRTLFRDVNFRRALTQSIDREGIAHSMTQGPFFRPWVGGLFPGSQFFDRKSVVYYPYSVDSGKALLAKVGLKDTDNDGYVNYTSGPLKGQDVEVEIQCGQDISAGQTIGGALVQMFKEIGLKATYKEMVGTVLTSEDQSGTWELRVNRPGQAWAVPQIRANEIATMTDLTPNWHRTSAGVARKEQPFETQLTKIVREFAKEPDATKQKALMSQYLKIYTENVYSIGLVCSRYGLMMNKNIKNTPAGCPAFFIQWSHQNMLPEQLWFPKENQRKEVQPNTVPMYN
jgi:peptide/nickel transport system substrate-binding protein